MGENSKESRPSDKICDLENYEVTFSGKNGVRK